MNQLYIYIYPHISPLLPLPHSHPPYPTRLGGHKALNWCPCAMQLLPTSYFFTFGSVYRSMPLSHFVPAYPSLIIWFIFFNLIVCCITLIDLHILKNPCIPGINPTWSWCMILLMCYWILFASILLRIFASMFISDIGL